MPSPGPLPPRAPVGRSTAPLVVAAAYSALAVGWVAGADSAADARAAAGVTLALLTAAVVVGLARREAAARRHARSAVTRGYEETLAGWTRALDMRDKATTDHTLRVTDVAVRLAAALGVRGDDLEHVRRGALVHDIGKMAVPDAILHKPGPLTADEWAVMRRHPEYARRMLEPIEFLRPALAIPVSHHERWDGTGYPLGLKGEAIPLAARIVAVVDVWDALSADRPYRRGWPAADVREYLRARAGTEFDPRVVAAFLALLGADPLTDTPPPQAAVTPHPIAVPRPRQSGPGCLPEPPSDGAAAGGHPAPAAPS